MPQLRSIISDRDEADLLFYQNTQLKAELERMRAAGSDMIAEIINSNATPDMGELNGWMAMFGFGDPTPSASSTGDRNDE